MKTFFIIITLITIFTLQGNSHEIRTSKIEVQKVFGGYNFISDGKKLKMNELVMMLETYQPAHIKIKSARADYSIATAVSMAGGFIIGWQLGNAISGNSIKWEMVALGSGVAIMSIPLIKSSFKKAVGAVDLYNKQLSGKTACHKQAFAKFSLCFKSGSVGIKVKIPIGIKS